MNYENEKDHGHGGDNCCKNNGQQPRFNKKYFWLFFIGFILITDLIFFVIIPKLQDKEVEQVEIESVNPDVSIYESEDGSFSFKYPNSHYVSDAGGSEDPDIKQFYIIQHSSGEGDYPPPDMVIKVDKTNLRTEFYTWESFWWPPYYEVVSSFKFSEDRN